ncbi:MAG: D-glycerate dehydrogenase [Candidatus Thermoplasmatota archaeon]|nr:D-glycerate dehydrogenase [Candidatus Thermoplasmatota archaeon]MBS3790056.1 D-glycerate dehydrogenase [Candidatus Thermoplasmatota archaeon]
MDIFVTRKIPEIGIEKLKERYDVEVSQKPRNLTKKELIENVKEKDALLCLLTDTIDEDIIDAGKDLKAISNYAVGYDNIDVGAATERGIAVTNTPGVLTEATAEIAWSLMMAVARNVVSGDKFVREDRFEGWDPTLMLGHELHGKTLGIVGMGNIGSKVAEISQGFDMDIIYYNRSEKKDIEEKLGAEYVELDELLVRSDFVSLHVPLTEETEGMIGEDELEKMNEDSYLINTARGEVVDEDALVETLKEGGIAGAGIDVYADEPHGANPDYYELDNVVLTPHLGSASFRAREGMAVMAAENIIAVLEGDEPDNIVNPTVFK